MKPELTMSDNKDSIPDVPVVITQMASTPEPRKSKTKKYLIIGGSVVVVIAIVLTAILVGMYFFTKAQTDLIKYTLKAAKDTKEEVTMDTNENSIEYRLRNDQYETLVVDDFNRDIQLLKVKTGRGTNCYITPLNRTSRADPSTISALQELPSEANQNYTWKLSYDISETPVSDSSFLGKKARDACQGVSVYWMYPRCSDPGASEHRRSKRCWSYCYFYSYYCDDGWDVCTDYLCLHMYDLDYEEEF